MARINLLPWREWERERKKNEFLRNLGIVAGVGALIIVAVMQSVDGDIQSQNRRNAFLEGKIVEVDAKIKEIQDLKMKREQLLARMRVIQELQGNRPVIVRVFDELVRSLANGVHYTSVSMAGNAISMEGIAESNTRISAEMRNLDNSEWFAEPNLKTIKENPAAGPQASSFVLSVKQVNPRLVTDPEE